VSHRPFSIRPLARSPGLTRARTLRRQRRRPRSRRGRHRPEEWAGPAPDPPRRRPRLPSVHGV